MTSREPISWQESLCDFSVPLHPLAQAVDPVAHATFTSIPNGPGMASIGLDFFALHPNAAKSWGRWTRALLVILWGFTASGDVEAITGVEALAMWTQATTVINQVLQGLPIAARLQMRD